MIDASTSSQEGEVVRLITDLKSAELDLQNWVTGHESAFEKGWRNMCIDTLTQINLGVYWSTDAN